MKKMLDLVYFGYCYDPESRKLEKEFIEEVEEAFPDFELQDSFDEIKGHRQSVFGDEEKKRDYQLWALCHGWFNCSLGLALLKSEELSSLVEEGRKVYPECYKDNNNETQQ
jgi:hypothetical protein